VLVVIASVVADAAEAVATTRITGRLTARHPMKPRMFRIFDLPWAIPVFFNDTQLRGFCLESEAMNATGGLASGYSALAASIVKLFIRNLLRLSGQPG
jgi:hypothetical protein